MVFNYTLYKNPGFWLVISRYIFHVFSYLGLISFIFIAAGVFAWGFNLFTLACIKPPNSFGIFLLYLYTQSNVINQIWNPEVFRSKGFNFFSLCRGICENVYHLFTLTCRKSPNSLGILQPLSNKTNRNTTTVHAEGNSSKRSIVFNNCQVTNNNKRIFLKTTNKRYYLFSQCSK